MTTAPRLTVLRVMRHAVHGTLCIVGLLASAAAIPAFAQAPAATSDLSVAFDVDGRCRAAGGASSPATIEPAARPWRCVVGGMPPKRAVRLAVLMPSGYVVTDSFPRLAWRHTAAGEEGTALLPAAPAFVSVSLEHSEAAARAHWLDVLALAATAVAAIGSLIYGRRA